MRNPTKIVMRHLPPDLTEAEFLEVVSPFITPQNYVRFCSVDRTLGMYGTTRAYIDFSSIEALYQFKEKFDNFVFVDSKGNESYGLVEYSVNQKVPESFNSGKSKKSSGQKAEKRRPNTKLGTISKDPDYLAFEKDLEANKQSNESTNTASGDGAYIARGQALMEANLEEIKAKEKELESGHGMSKDKTPLLLYLEQKRNEKLTRRDEERRRMDERRKELKGKFNDPPAKRKEKPERDKNRATGKSLIDKSDKRKPAEDKSSKKEKLSSANKDVESQSKFNKDTRSDKASKPSKIKDENAKTKQLDIVGEASTSIADSSPAKESTPTSTSSANKPSGNSSGNPPKSSREFKSSAKSYAKSRATASNDDGKERRTHISEEYDDRPRRRPDSYYGHRSQQDYVDDYPRYSGRGRGRGGNRSARSYRDTPDYDYDYDYGYDYRDRRDRDYADSYDGRRRDYGYDYGDNYTRGRSDRGRHKPSSYSSSRKDASKAAK